MSSILSPNTVSAKNASAPSSLLARTQLSDFPLMVKIGLGYAVFIAVILALGGIVGYAKKGSKASIASGLGSAAVVALCLRMCSPESYKTSMFILALLNMILAAFFIARYSASRKFMPAGLMTLLSSIGFGLFVICLV